MLINVIPDKEKARSILMLVKEREEFVSQINQEKFSTNACENYYEIIKELATALLILEGLKAIGEYAHKDVIDHLIEYKEFTEKDIFLMNDLRIKRNNSAYDGKRVDPAYLTINKQEILRLMSLLKEAINKRLGQ